MEAEGATTASNDSLQQRRRQKCGTCERPVPVCLCHVIPSPPILSATEIIVIHHPHESNHKLNTTPLLTKSLGHVTAHISRKLLPRHVVNHNQSPSSSTFLYLFPPSPGSPAVTLSELKNSLGKGDQSTSDLVLIAFDATWTHAKEMVKASEGVLNSLGAIRVCLDVDESLSGASIYDNELVLRKEPFKGCVSTFEAVVRCLGAVEEKGDEIEMALIRVLRETVRLQAGFLKPVKPRPKLQKKNKQNQFETPNESCNC